MYVTFTKLPHGINMDRDPLEYRGNVITNLHRPPLIQARGFPQLPHFFNLKLTKSLSKYFVSGPCLLRIFRHNSPFCRKRRNERPTIPISPVSRFPIPPLGFRPPLLRFSLSFFICDFLFSLFSFGLGEKDPINTLV